MPIKRKFASRLIALAAIPCLAPVSAAQIPAGQIAKQLVKSEDQIAVAPQSTVRNLSSDTIDLATKLNLLPKLVHLEEERQNTSSDSQFFKLAALKQDLFYELMDYEYDIRIAMNRIEAEVDKANDKYALLAEKRDRAIRLNTYANLVSGGLTGIISGSLDLGQVNYIAPSTIDTIEGVIQTGLSAWGLHELRGEHKLERGVPNILSSLLESNTDARKYFPSSVWVYLNSVPENTLTGKTRRESLLDRWDKIGFGSRGLKKGSQQDRMTKAAGITQNPHRLTVRLLEDRMAMLIDLQTAVAEMETNLQEILQFVRGTRSLAQNTR
ncbi:MAG: hypothetical protein K2Y22_00700 [Candidatus Obscuribacterales bacterium]|nr:hypothetical protein [Candidatus Obscuribacterales bacterium]